MSIFQVMPQVPFNVIHRVLGVNKELKSFGDEIEIKFRILSHQPCSKMSAFDSPAQVIIKINHGGHAILINPADSLSNGAHDHPFNPILMDREALVVQKKIDDGAGVHDISLMVLIQKEYGIIQNLYQR